MSPSDVEQYFELAIDLPERKRAKLLARLDAEQPEVARSLRALLDGWTKNPDFACQTGVGGAPPRTPSPRHLDPVDQLAVPVADVPRAVAWYRERFACEVETQDTSGAVLRFANVRLALVAATGQSPHLAVIRSDAGTFGELRPQRDGTRAAELSDPWGNPIRVLDPGSVRDS